MRTWPYAADPADLPTEDERNDASAALEAIRAAVAELDGCDAAELGLAVDALGAAEAALDEATARARALR